ncbi:MAG TPA: radical SAM protein, partial [Candidatus Methylomirabilis sp.]|nr:radical SAM protein [Candidatus Methylomirabilis sp.]
MSRDACGKAKGQDGESLMQRIALKAEKNRVPLEVHLELTHRCNARCVHCYCVLPRELEASARQRELTTDEITRLLDDLAELGTLYLNFSGGEVLVRQDFFDIALHAKRRGFAFRIFTNGMGLTRERIERLAGLEPLTVEVSLYSADPDIHDGITGVPGSFDRLIENLSRLKAHGLRVYLKSIIMKPSLSGLERLHRLGKELDVFVHMYGCELSPRIAGEPHGPDRYQLDERELIDYFASPVWRKHLAPMPEGSPEQAAKRRPACAPGAIGCCVDPYGTVFPCVALRVPMGNIRERSFRALWTSMPPSILPFLSLETYADLPECRTCHLVDFC